MSVSKFVFGFKKPFGWFDFAHHKFAQGREKRARVKRLDLVTEQVKKVLTDVDQKLILMVRG